MSQYEYLSSIYDKSMNLSNIDYNKWFDKIINFLGKDSEKIKNILELGCGTGNITEKLLNYGYEVVGVDNSLEMLSIAREKLQEYSDKAIFLNRDICEMEFDIYEIDMILATNDVINYIVDYDKLNILFEFCYTHLRKDGILLFDISSKYKLENILGNNVFFEEDDYCMIWQNFYNKEDKIIDIYIDIFKENQEGYYERFQEEHTQRAYEEEEIEKMLKKCGFKDIKKEYYYNHNTDDAQRIFFLAKK